MIDRGEFFQGFIRADDLKAGQLLKIISFERTKTRNGVQPSLRVEGQDKPLSLNATNLDFLIESFGNDEGKWPGKTIKVKLEPVENFKTGKFVTGIRLTK